MDHSADVDAVAARLRRDAVAARTRRSVAADLPAVAPAELRASAGRPTRWQLSVRLGVALVVVAVGMTGWLLIRTPGTVSTPAVHLPSVAASSSGKATAAARGPAAGNTPSPSEQAQVTVHVVGAVAVQGVQRLPSGSRVEDAVAAAGGATVDADVSAINLARVLVDGEQVVVPTVGSAAAGGATGSTVTEGTSGAAASAAAGAGAAVDVNSATASQLDELPGIGPVIAQRIVDWRLANGPFGSVEALEDVPGIGPALLAKLGNRVVVP